MKIAIFGCRDGGYLLDQIKQNKDAEYETICFCDNNKKIQETEIDGIPVVDIKQLSDKYKSQSIEAVIIAVRKGYSRYCIIEQLKEAGIENIILLRPSVLTFHLPIIFDSDNPLYHRHWLILNDTKKTIIHHLEAHAADGCNLNCRGCLHFSNLFKRDEFPDLKELLKSIEEIERNCEIFQFRVLGGEPLLNTELPAFLTDLRSILPNSDLAVISNGILIQKTDPELFKVMAKNGIGFNLTLYPPTISMKDIIETILNEYGVPYGSHIAKTDEFEKFMTLKRHDRSGHMAHKKCEPRGIIVVRGRKLYKCPIEAYGDKYNDFYGLGVDYSDAGIDVFKSGLDWDKTIEDLTADPIDLCSYCSEKSSFYHWSVGKPEKEDWLVYD